MKICVTGFSAFPGVPVNPTELLIEHFRQKPSTLTAGPIEFSFNVIETQYEQGGAHVQRLLRDTNPQYLLLLGVAASRSSFSLERFALNIDDASIPDASGDVRRGRRIEKMGPLALETKVDVDKLRESLIRSDVDVEISNHAGTYVCNHVYYVALHCVEVLGLSTRVVFLHTPLAPAASAQLTLAGGTVRTIRQDAELVLTHLIGC